MTQITKPAPRVLIGALSGRIYEDRRERCRQTWMRDATAMGVDAFFLMAADDGPRRDGDILYIPGHDAYDFLPQRTLWFCRYALERDDWDWLFKCDDDTYVCMTRLLAAVEEYSRQPNVSYVGAEWTPGVNYGSGGAGYLINRQCARIIASEMLNPIGSEDMMVGQHLGRRRHYLTIDQRFVPYGNENLRPKPDNDLITLHAVGAELFYQTASEVGLESVSEVDPEGDKPEKSNRETATPAQDSTGGPGAAK